MKENITAEADRLSRRRARIVTVLAVVYLAQQVSYFSSGEGNRTVDHVKIGAWALMSLVLLVLLVTGGAWMRRAELRALLNDESTRANRLRALKLGFIAAMLAGIGTYVVSTATVITTREAIHLIVSSGIAAALVAFGLLERRAHRDG